MGTEADTAYLVPRITIKVGKITPESLKPGTAKQ